MKTSRQPWKRLTAVAAPAGHGTVLVEQARRSGPLTPAQYGRRVERDAEKWFTTRGYTMTRSHLSRGRADFVAIGVDVCQVQVKSASTPARLNAAIHACAADMEAMPKGARRIGVIYLYGRGEVCRLELDGTGWTAEGRQHKTALAALARRKTA